MLFTKGIGNGDVNRYKETVCSVLNRDFRGSVRKYL